MLREHKLESGYSAATAIYQLAALAEQHPSTWVFWLTRGPRGAPLPRIPNDPLKDRDKLAVKANSLATRSDGNLEFHPQMQLDEVTAHGPDNLTFEECERLEEEATPYIRDALLKERMLHWRAQLDAEAV